MSHRALRRTMQAASLRRADVYSPNLPAKKPAAGSCPPRFPPRSDSMDQPKDAPKPKSPEKKASPQNNNLLWYLLGLGVLLLLLVTVWGSQHKLTIQWSNLEKLIVASNPKAPEGTVKYIIHVDETTKPPTRYMLQDPKDILVGPSEVTGTVMALKLPSGDE